MEAYQIIKKPLLTEKSSRLKENNQYVFVVDKNADKISIRKAVESMFKVKVLRVNTANVMGKKKRLGMRQGKRSDWKKAFVWIKKGEKIEALEI